MSSYIRRIQRTLKRAKDPACKAPHFMRRGSKLGVVNLKDPCRLAREARDRKWGRS